MTPTSDITRALSGEWTIDPEKEMDDFWDDRIEREMARRSKELEDRLEAEMAKAKIIDASNDIENHFERECQYYNDRVMEEIKARAIADENINRIQCDEYNDQFMEEIIRLRNSLKDDKDEPKTERDQYLDRIGVSDE